MFKRLCLTITVVLLAGCGGAAQPKPPPPAKPVAAPREWFLELYEGSGFVPPQEAHSVSGRVRGDGVVAVECSGPGKRVRHIRTRLSKDELAWANETARALLARHTHRVVPEIPDLGEQLVKVRGRAMVPIEHMDGYDARLSAHAVLAAVAGTC